MTQDALYASLEVLPGLVIDMFRRMRAVGSGGRLAIVLRRMGRWQPVRSVEHRSRASGGRCVDHWVILVSVR